MMKNTSIPAIAPLDLNVERLRLPPIPSPLVARGEPFMRDEDRVLWSCNVQDVEPLSSLGSPLPSFESAGPRKEIVFNPHETTCGIVTCGGLCPGLNDVVRSITLTLSYAYGVSNVLGFRYGYAGIPQRNGHEPLQLTKEVVTRIHNWGGTILGSSRGAQDAGEMVDSLVANKVSILFTIGGDGTLRGASALCAEIKRRGLPIGIVGVPKTIDNDLMWIERSFGFASAVDEARRAVDAAHTEARGVWNGVGIVKLMGRYSGFIAAHATLASNDVNFCLVPEVPFDLEGPSGFLATLEHRLRSRRHAVIVVAEGAGQHLMPPTTETDASGNVKLQDIGVFLRDEIHRYFKSHKEPIAVRYIDPSYLVRGIPANASDAELCLKLGQCAVHAGMAGRTNMLVGYWNQRFTHVPIQVAVQRRKQLDIASKVWRSVLSTTGQPERMLGSG